MEISHHPSGYADLRSTGQDPSPDVSVAQGLPEASHRRASVLVRKERNDCDGDSDDGAAAKRSDADFTTDNSTASGAADAYSDDYAKHVVDAGGQTPLSDAQLRELRHDVVRSVDASRGRLIDQHTTDMIRDTVLGALDRSPTFRAAVSYGLHNNQVNLGDIAYSNEYESSCFDAGEDMPRSLSELTLNDVQSRDAQAPALFPNTLAIQLSPGHACVSMGAAPDSDSPYMPAWQEALIHEIMHHVTGSEDPRGSGENEQGPTELLARRVADEMEWHIPTFRGYGDPARTAYIRERNYAGLNDTLRRHPGHERALFARLDTISFGEIAPVNFRNPDYCRSSVVSDPVGVPTGFPNALAATGANWATQGRFFQYGKPVDGNPHVRAFTFADGSKVVVRAHEPMLADSDAMKFGRIVAVSSSAMVGGVSGFFAGGPAGAIAGAVAAAIPVSTLVRFYDFDRVWQGYTLNYYGKGLKNPFETQYMYAWDSDKKRIEQMSTIKDPQKWLDYANFNPDKNWAWWKWRAGSAPLSI